MALLLENLRCIDPALGLDEHCNLAIKDGRIVARGPDVDIEKGVRRDLSGRIALPGLMDMHVHLREPGEEYKEDLASGARAAARGGFTAVLAMPNTVPVCDTGSRVAFVLDKAAQAGLRTRIFVAGALTQGLKGTSLAEMGDMHRAGAVAFTDDGRGVQDSGVARRAMEYCRQFGTPVLSHCQAEDLAGAGVVNEGVASTRLGLAGWAAAAEEFMIARDIALAELTGSALHIQHLTTARGVELVRAARERGLPISSEVTPHHLFLNEDCLDEDYNTALKVNPPLRTQADNRALQGALAEGVIDCVASDHAPHAAHEKALEFELAPFGTTGLETSLALVLTHLVRPGLLSYAQLVERMAHAPRRILGLEPVSLSVGSVADITVLDPELRWTAGADGWESKSEGSAFAGSTLIGRATDVYVGGYASLQDGAVQ
ncbi:MAG: dihydroorotase, partial [Coriobacteriales bacterium]|nr:dihydroorotase [Coriobacteriales bacterium]